MYLGRNSISQQFDEEDGDAEGLYQSESMYGWLCEWNTSTVPNGSYVLVSEAFNSAGSAFGSGVGITIKN